MGSGIRQAEGCEICRAPCEHDHKSRRTLSSRGPCTLPCLCAEASVSSACAVLPCRDDVLVCDEQVDVARAEHARSQRRCTPSVAPSTLLSPPGSESMRALDQLLLLSLLPPTRSSPIICGIDDCHANSMPIVCHWYDITCGLFLLEWTLPFVQGSRPTARLRAPSRRYRHKPSPARTASLLDEGRRSRRANGKGKFTCHLHTRDGRAMSSWHVRPGRRTYLLGHSNRMLPSEM